MSIARHSITRDPTLDDGDGLPTPRSGGASAFVRGNIVIMAGMCNVVKPFDQVEAFNVETGQWRALEPMPIGKHGITAATDGTTIYIAGGNPECGLSYSNRLVTFTLP